MTFPADLRAHVSWARFLVLGIVVTAADRAAATYAVWRRTPPPACCGHLPFQGRLCTGSLQKSPSAEGTVSRRLTEDKPLKPDFMLLAFSSDFSPLPASHPIRRKSAAALSAAVDTTNSQETAPTLQAEPSQQKQPRQAPAALREGARGRSFSQRSCLPRNPVSSPTFLFVRGCGGECFSIEKHSPPQALTIFL